MTPTPPSGALRPVKIAVVATVCVLLYALFARSTTIPIMTERTMDDEVSTLRDQGLSDMDDSYEHDQAVPLFTADDTKLRGQSPRSQGRLSTSGRDADDRLISDVSVEGSEVDTRLPSLADSPSDSHVARGRTRHHSRMAQRSARPGPSRADAGKPPASNSGVSFDAGHPWSTYALNLHIDPASNDNRTERALTNDRLHGLEADRALCGTSPCRVLVPGWIGDDGSEAHVRQQLIQLGLLTTALNEAYRKAHHCSASSGCSHEAVSSGSFASPNPYVLVLPNVSGSRIGSCYKKPFHFYYDTSPAALMSLGLQHTVSFEAFLQWLETRPVRPKSQVVVVQQNPRIAAKPTSDSLEIGRVHGGGMTEGPFAELVYDFNDVPSKGRHDHCLDWKAEWLLFSRHRPPMTVFPPATPKLWDQDKGAKEVMRLAVMEALGIRSNSLSAEDLPTRVPNVFVLDWALRSSVFPIESLKPQFHGNMDRSQTILQRGETPQIFGLPYNPRWIHLAEDISSVLGSYVVVRWNPDISGSCKSSFLRSLQTIPSDSSNSRIYAVYITAESLSRLPQSTERSSDRMAGDTPDQALSSLRKELRTHGILQGKKLASLTDVLRAFSKHDPSGRSDEDGLVEALTTGDIDWALRAFVDDRVVSGAQLVIDASETCGKGGE